MVHVRIPVRSVGRLLLGAGVLLALTFALTPTVTQAGPVLPEPVLLVQPDGATFTALPWGDEWTNGYETAAGFTVMQESESGIWRIAEVAADGRLIPGALRPEQAAAAAVGEPHLRPLATTSDLPPPWASPWAPPLASESAPAPEATENSGSQPTLVILVQFNNRAAVGTTPAQWSSNFFAATNSVHHYYNEVSYGKLNIAPASESHGAANDGVIGWLNIGYNHPDTRGNTTTANIKLARDAMIAADAYINYAAYDANGDGVLSTQELHIVVIAAGYETSYGGASSSCTPGLWGHQYALRYGADYGYPAPTLDGKKIGYYGYTQFGEYHCRSSDNPGHPATMGIMTHEMGHDLNWPDLYDTDNSSYGVGKWSVMGYGSWLSTSGYPGSKPPHPDAFLKSYQGWLTPVQITGPQAGVSIAQAATSQNVIQLLANPNGVDWVFNSKSGAGEYFLIENRQKVGYDAGLPGCGLLIWHIDETRTSTNQANAADARRLVDLEEADGLRQIDGSTSQGDGGDPFPGSTANRSFTNTSNPNSKLYSGAASGVQVANISAACAPTMSANFNGATSAAPKRVFLPLIVNMRPTAAGGIQGVVRLNGAPIGGINLSLLQCSAASCNFVRTTRTTASGAYSFTDAPSLSAGLTYAVVYQNGAPGGNSDNAAALAYWRSFPITGYTAGATVAGGDFDIGNVSLLAPANNASLTLPATFSWAGRGVPGDTYSLAFADETGDELCYVDPPRSGTSSGLDAQDAAVCGMGYNTTYGWYVYVTHGGWAGGYGLSRYYRNVRFVPGSLAPEPVIEDGAPADYELPMTNYDWTPSVTPGARRLP